MCVEELNERFDCLVSIAHVVVSVRGGARLTQRRATALYFKTENVKCVGWAINRISNR